MKIKKGIVKSFVLFLICAMVTGTFGWEAVLTNASTVYLVDIDSAMQLANNTNGNRDLSQNGKVVEHINWQGNFTASLAENNTQFVISQNKSTAWQQRLLVRNPSSVQMNVPTVFEARFKVKAADYSLSPEARLTFYGGDLGSFAEMKATTIPLTAAMEDTWKTIKYTVDASTKTITGVMDGTTVSTVSFGASAPTTAFTGFGLFPVAQNAGRYVDGDVLNTTITWTFDYIKVYQNQNSDPPDTEQQNLLSIDGAMQLSNNTSGNRNLSENGTIEHINWVGNFTASLAENNSQFVISQTKSSAWNQRLMVRNPASFQMTAPVVFESKFKVKAADYSTSPQAKFIFNGGDLGVYLEMSSAIPLSAATEETWQTIKYTIDPATKSIKGELNGSQVSSGAFGGTAPTTSFTGIGLYPVAQNAGRNADGDVLNTTITWTFDSFKISQATDVTPPPSTEFQELVNISSAMQLVNNTNGNRDLSQKGTIEHINYVGGFTASLAGNNTQFVINQTKSSAWNQRLMVKNPATFQMGAPTVFEAKFKIKADDYSKNPEAKFIFNAGNLGIYLQMSSTVSLSAATADTVQTIKFTMDPSTKTVKGELNGSTVTSGSFGATAPTDVFSGIGLYPVAQNAGGNSDGTALNTPITWTFTSIRVTYGTEDDVNPEPEPQQPLLIDNSMQLSSNTSGNRDLTEDGTIEHINYNGGFTASLAEGNSQFVINQTKSATWNQRLMVKNPGVFQLSAPLVFETKFKIKADSYSGTVPKAKFVFYTGTLGNLQEMTLGTIPVSAETQDTWQVMKYTVDPETRRITGELNGQAVVSSAFAANAPTGTFSTLGIYPAVQNPGGAADNELLSTPVTWTFDYFKLYQVVGLSPLAEPVTADPWQSIAYPSGTGRDETKQIADCIVSLGSEADINKIEINHDTSKIMSFTLFTSRDGLTYKPVTDTYAGGLPKYSGQQTYRFAPSRTKYVKYRAVLLGDEYETQAVLNSMVISFTNTQELSFVDVPSVINPVDTSEVILRTSALDEDGDQYILTRQGVTYSLEGTVPSGVSVNGCVLSVENVTSAANFNLVATDASGEITATKEISVVPQVSVRNFALYSDEACTVPVSVLTGGSNVYAKAEILASSGVADKSVSIIIGAYKNTDGVKKLSKIYSSEAVQAPVSGDYVPVSASLTLPSDITSNDCINALIWNISNINPLAPTVSYSPSGSGEGLSASNIFLDKSAQITIKASSHGQDITWESTDSRIASVNNGAITGKGEGTAVVTAKVGRTVIGSAKVKVKPSLYVYLLMGQSNMSGTNSPISEGITVPISSNVKLLNKQGVFEQAKHPYRRHSGVAGLGTTPPYIGWSDASEVIDENGGINAGYEFSELLAAEHPDIDIGLVVNSSSGCSIFAYERNAPESYPTANGFANTVERIRQATAGRGEFKGIIWHQGESDQNDSTYAVRQRNLIYDLRLELDSPEVPFIAGGLSEDQRSTASLNSAVDANKYKVANFGFASSVLPTMLQNRARVGASVYPNATTDYTHFSARGQIEFGKRYYAQYVDIISKAKR